MSLRLMIVSSGVGTSNADSPTDQMLGFLPWKISRLFVSVHMPSVNAGLENNHSPAVFASGLVPLISTITCSSISVRCVHLPKAVAEFGSGGPF